LKTSPPLATDVAGIRLATVRVRAFPVAAFRLWNSLPQNVDTSAPSLTVFSKCLKTNLFSHSSAKSTLVL